MTSEAHKLLADANIPALYRREDSRLQMSKDKLGDELYDFTDPDKTKAFEAAKQKRLWMIYGQPIAHCRELNFLLAKALTVTNLDVLCANMNTLQNLLVSGSDDEKELEFIDRCRNVDFLVLDDFYDESFGDKWSMAKMPLLHLIRRRIESELNTIVYSSHALNLMKDAWPSSFITYLGYHVHYFSLKGNRK